MTPRFFRRVMLAAWAIGAPSVAFLLLGHPGLVPAWLDLVAVVTAAVAVPVAIWSPVGLACAAALRSGTLPRTSRAGVVLSWVAAAMQVRYLVDYAPKGRLWTDVLRMGLPVMLLALACANASLLSMARVGPRLRWLGTCSVAAMFTLTALVTVMVIVDSGNHALFGVLGVLLLVAVASALLVAVAHWRGRLATRKARGATPDSAVDLR